MNDHPTPEPPEDSSSPLEDADTIEQVGESDSSKKSESSEVDPRSETDELSAMEQKEELSAEQGVLNDLANDNQNESSPAELGRILRQAREDLKLSSLDVARELNITQSFVEAIESGNLERLPNLAYVRGYCASYALYVGVDKSRVLDIFDNKPSSPSIPATKAQRKKVYVNKDEKLKQFLALNSAKILTVLIVVTVVGLGGVIWYLWSSDAALPSASLPAIDDPVVEQRANSVEPAPVVTTMADSDGISVVPPREPDPIEEVDTQPGAEEDIAIDGSQEAIPIGLVDDDQLNPADPSAVGTDSMVGTDESGQQEVVQGFDENERKLIEAEENGLPIGNLLVELTDECWVEVRDRYDDLIYMDLKTSGETVLISGVAPLDVKLGNAEVASVYFNGEKVALTPLASSGVARVTLR